MSALDTFRDTYCNWSRPRSLFVTFDVDWAPDYMISHVLSVLEQQGVTATFFATHPSELLRRVAAEGRHEVGLHPNLSANSTQGNDFTSIMTNLKKLYPGAVGNRFHILGYSYRDLLKLADHGMRYDVSTVYFNTSHLQPTYQLDTKLVMMPYSWEDGVCENQNLPMNEANMVIDTPGLKVFNFHPMNAFLNCPNAAWRKKFQAECPRVLDTPEAQAKQYQYTDGHGAGTALVSLIARAKAAGMQLRRLSEIDTAYRAIAGAS